MKQNEQLRQPFFAKFLEAQKKTKETAQDNAPGDPRITMRIFFDYDQTMKYPSDGDDDIYI